MQLEREKNRREFDFELDRLEQFIADLKVQYEQYFLDVIPNPPNKLQRDVRILIRRLLKAPFKSAANRFRLRMLIQRYQTFHTYWERTMKQREDGTYSRDVFKAEMREKALAQEEWEKSTMGAADRGLKRLYSTYTTALAKNGNGAAKLDFAAFKKSLLKKAKQLKSQKGITKLHYKVVVKNGKVVVKASPKG